MIPPFDDRGYLPPGTHLARLDEIEARFGQNSEIRVAQMESLHWLIGLAKRAGVLRLIINGSFVTDKIEPNDVDCALLIGSGFPADIRAETELVAGLPFLDIHLMIQDDFELLVERVYATDRRYVAKGMLEVIL